MRWVVVLPVKRLGGAKTRLARPDRSDVALAMAADTAIAAAASPAVAAVLVVSDDPRTGPALQGYADVVADAPDAGLNAALTHGTGAAAERWPDCGVVALAADLPALHADELTAALSAAEAAPRSVVADAQGTGTVLLAARPGVPLAPAFGPDSRAAHTGAGAADLTEQLGSAVGGLRRDVDTLSDLEAAVLLGLGTRSAAVVAGVQATVRLWSAEHGGGDAVTDHGRRVELPASARLLGSLRALRPGQRVALSLTPGRPGTVGAIALVSEA